MANPYFHFKQFTVYHDRCAMKVGTDGVLLGAWTLINGGEKRILDIGTGSGLVALMLAQRCAQAKITGIDIEKDAIMQAQQNFAASKWASRLNAQQISIQDFIKINAEHFDCVVSNPPFFSNSLRNPQKSRATARHTDTLSYEELVESAAALLAKNGLFACILPASEEENIKKIAATNNLFLCQKMSVKPKLQSPPKRILMAFAKYEKDYVEKVLVLEDEHAHRSADYQKLTHDFYL